MQDSSDVLQGCSKKSDTALTITKNVYQGRRHNFVTIFVYTMARIRLVGTTLNRFDNNQQGCYKLLTACCILVDNLGQAVQTPTC